MFKSTDGFIADVDWRLAGNSPPGTHRLAQPFYARYVKMRWESTAGEHTGSTAALFGCNENTCTKQTCPTIDDPNAVVVYSDPASVDFGPRQEGSIATVSCNAPFTIGSDSIRKTLFNVFVSAPLRRTRPVGIFGFVLRQSQFL